MNALTEDIKKEEVKEEKATETTEEVVEEAKEATETTEEVVEETKETSELEEAQARAEEFENKYLRVHAEMQNIQRRAKEERQQLQKYRSQDLAKAILPALFISFFTILSIILCYSHLFTRPDASPIIKAKTSSLET